MRKLEFTFDDEGKEHYEVCVQAITMSGRPVRPEEWDDFLPLKRKLVSFGQPAAKQPPGAQAHRPQLFDLQAGSIVLLERGEYNLLLDLIKQPNWSSAALEGVIMTRDWLQKIQEFDKNGVSNA